MHITKKKLVLPQLIIIYINRMTHLDRKIQGIRIYTTETAGYSLSIEQKKEEKKSQKNV